MNTGINESKNLTKDLSCKFKCRVDGKNVIHNNGGITTNADVSAKNIVYVK